MPVDGRLVNIISRQAIAGPGRVVSSIGWQAFL